VKCVVEPFGVEQQRHGTELLKGGYERTGLC